jgi:peptidoglycan/xylan/chitin deacetylase (PgdA/CDA1 family)
MSTSAATSTQLLTTVFMYHAVSDQAGLAQADPQYTVSPAGLRAQLRCLAEQQMQACSVLGLLAKPAWPQRRVALTFDDGHVSNAWVAQELAGAGASADFFINPGRMGRAGYLGWADVREMAALGMSIQSHGMDHRYLDEMSAVEVDDDLRRSKGMIEDRLGQPVCLFAPPGGRRSPGLAGAAQALGYRRVCSSRPGWWHRNGTQAEVPRMAVLASTSLAQWQRWAQQRNSELWRQRSRYETLAWAKRLLGKQRYERWRRLALGPDLSDLSQQAPP